MSCPGLESFRIIKTTPRSAAGGSWFILAARRVFFGATVTYVDGRVNVKTITIVGIDEADLSRGQVSWVSPVARALMKARQGDIVEVRAPSGVEQIEVLEIRYSGVRGETE